MEKIKKIVNVLPWVILIIAITAIVAEVRYINIEKENYESYNKTLTETFAELQTESVELQSKTDELKAEAADLQSKADFYQEQIDAFEDKPNERQGVIDGLSEQIKQIYTADPKALDAFAKDLFMKAANEIAKNDYSNFPEYTIRRWDAGVTEPLEITIDGYKYVMRNEQVFYAYDDDYYTTFTSELLDKVRDKRFTVKEGFLYIKEIEAGAKEWGVANAELTRVSETDDEIKYSVKYDREENGQITDKGLTCTMTIKYEDGRYRVSDTDFGNL